MLPFRVTVRMKWVGIGNVLKSRLNKSLRNSDRLKRKGCPREGGEMNAVWQLTLWKSISLDYVKKGLFVLIFWERNKVTIQWCAFFLQLASYMSTNCFKWTSKATHFDLYCRNNSTYFVDPPILWLCLCYNCQTDENYLIDGCGVLWEESVCFISLYIFSPLICNLWSILSVVKIDMHKINSSLFLMFKGY